MHKLEPCKSHYQVGNSETFDYYATARGINKAANISRDQFQNQHTRRREKHANKLARFLLLYPDEYKNLTENTSSPDNSKCATFFKVLSGDKTSAKEMLTERIMIDYFRRSEALCKERVKNAEGEISFLQPSTFNTNMRSLLAELKECNIHFDYEKDLKEFQAEVATKIQKLHSQCGADYGSSSKKKRAK